MQEIGIYEAKTNISKIIDAVERGESFIITRRGKPVAELKEPETTEKQKREQRDKAISELLDIRKNLSKKGMNFDRDEIVEMIRKDRDRDERRF